MCAHNGGKVPIEKEKKCALCVYSVMYVTMYGEVYCESVCAICNILHFEDYLSSMQYRSSAIFVLSVVSCVTLFFVLGISST